MSKINPLFEDTTDSENQANYFKEDQVINSFDG